MRNIRIFNRLNNKLDTIIRVVCFLSGLIMIFLFFSIIILSYVDMQLNLIFIQLGPFDYNLETIIFCFAQGILGVVVLVIALKPNGKSIKRQ